MRSKALKKHRQSFWLKEKENHMHKYYFHIRILVILFDFLKTPQNLMFKNDKQKQKQIQNQIINTLINATSNR